METTLNNTFNPAQDLKNFSNGIRQHWWRILLLCVVISTSALLIVEAGNFFGSIWKAALLEIIVIALIPIRMPGRVSYAAKGMVVIGVFVIVIASASQHAIQPFMANDGIKAADKQKLESLRYAVDSHQMALQGMVDTGQPRNAAIAREKLQRATEEYQAFANTVQPDAAIVANNRASILFAVFMRVCLQLGNYLLVHFLASSIRVNRRDESVQRPVNSMAIQYQPEIPVESDTPDKLLSYIHRKGGNVSRREIATSRLFNGQPEYDGAIEALIAQNKIFVDQTPEKQMDWRYLLIGGNGKEGKATPKIISNQFGFIPLIAVGIMALTGAGLTTAYYLDHSGKGIDFSLINPETADSVGAAGRENRMMAEDFISGYSDFQRENNRTIESLTSTYLVEYDQLRADLRQSEAAHRATLDGQDNLLIVVLLAVCGLMAWLFISAARHPRSVSPGPRNISGRPEAYELANGSTLFIDSNGQRMICRPKDAVGLLRNQSGGADPVLMSVLIGCIGLALIVALIAGDRPTPVVTGAANTGEIRMMAETLNAQSMEQIDRMAGYMMQANESHVTSLRTYAGRSGAAFAVFLFSLVVLGFAILALVLVLRLRGRLDIPTRPTQPTRIEREREVVYLIRDESGALHRIEGQQFQQIGMNADPVKLLSNDRGNANIRLAAIVFLVAAMAIFAIKYIGGIDALTGSPAKAQPANVMVNDVSGVAIMFIRNPHGNPVQKYCVMYADGETAEVSKGVADAAIRQLVGSGGNGVRQMGGVR